MTEIVCRCQKPRWSEPMRLGNITVDYCERCGARRERIGLEYYWRRQQELKDYGSFGPRDGEAAGGRSV